MRQPSAILVGDVTVTVGTNSVTVGTPWKGDPMLELSDGTAFSDRVYDSDGYRKLTYYIGTIHIYA